MTIILYPDFYSDISNIHELAADFMYFNGSVNITA